MAQLRQQMTLELGLLNKKKTPKVIQLIEEFRRDIPLVENRVDEKRTPWLSQLIRKGCSRQFGKRVPKWSG